MSTMKLFVDKVSPVCRAVMLFAAVNKIPYEEVHISLHKRWLIDLHASGKSSFPAQTLPETQCSWLLMVGYYS